MYLDVKVIMFNPPVNRAEVVLLTGRIAQDVHSDRVSAAMSE